MYGVGEDIEAVVEEVDKEEDDDGQKTELSARPNLKLCQ